MGRKDADSPSFSAPWRVDARRSGGSVTFDPELSDGARAMCTRCRW